MEMSPFFKVEIFSDFSQCLCITATATVVFFLSKYLLPSFLSLGFLSFPNVGVETSSHVTSVICSHATDLVIPLLDDPSHSLCTRAVPVPFVGSWVPEISAQNCLQFYAISRTTKGGGMGKDFLLILQKDSAHKSMTLTQLCWARSLCRGSHQQEGAVIPSDSPLNCPGALWQSLT